MKIKAVVLGITCLVLGGACNWWPESYLLGGVYWQRARWTSNDVEFAKCKPIAGTSYFDCWAKPSQMVPVGGKTCMPMQPTAWCIGDPYPPNIASITLVNY